MTNPPSRLRTLFYLLQKEFLQLRRDPRIVQIVVLGPVIQLLIFGLAINLDVNHIDLDVCDLDRSAESRQLVQRFTNSGYFDLKASLVLPSEIDHRLENGDAAIALTIPKGFGRKLAAGDQVALQAIADGSESNAASAGLAYASMIVTAYSQNILLDRLARAGGGERKAAIVPEVRVWYNPELESRKFLVPGILGLLLMTATAMLSSLAIVKEKELGTMEQLIVTPIKPYELIIGKLTPFFIIGMIDVLLVTAGVTMIFGIPVRGSVALLIALGALFLFTTLGLGLFISTVSRTQQQAMMTSMFFVLMPMNFLSGFIFPIENMPPIIQGVSYLLPLRYFFEIIRGIFLRGVGMETLWPQALALAVFGIAIITLSTLRFRARLES